MTTWAIVLIVTLSVLAILGSVYWLLFFVLNKYVVLDGKVIRAFRIGREAGQIHLLTFKCTMEYRIPEEVYETKQKAEEANNQGK